MIKKFLIITVSLVFSFFVISCKNNDDINEEILEKQGLEDTVNNIVSIVSSADYNKDAFSDNPFMTYFIDSGNLVGYNYNKYSGIRENNLTKSIKIDNNVNGQIIKAQDGEIYVSITTNDYCAVKGFKKDDIEVYNILEKEKCHIFYVTNNQIDLGIVGKELENNVNYNFGNISNGIVELTAYSNILDDYNCTYTWYRNGEVIENVSGRTYVITAEYEDADYSVKVTTPKGKKDISDPVNVKINRIV